MEISDLIKKSRNAEPFAKKELILMLGLAPTSSDVYLIMAEANRIAREVSQGKAEVHAQFALNLARCGCDCRFCSFAAVNDIFKENIEIGAAEAIQKALRFEADGANAIFLMATANYSFGKFIEISREVRKVLEPETMMIANVGDQSLREAKRLREAGFQGVYHALRLREGVDTGIAPEKRKKTIRNFQEAGLLVGTCVEPVGPDHTDEELAEMILYTASIKPAYSGAARRITIPGGVMEQAGMITELRMAQIVAVTRLAMPHGTKGNCTHEPCTIGALAGTNLFWAEVGANPRDVKENTEEGRGGTVAHCRKLFQEADWETLVGPSVFYGEAKL
jgi:biotin synthase